MLNSNNEKLKTSSSQYAQYYTQKNVQGIGELLNDNVALFDPEFKWIKGKENVINLFQEIFNKTKKVSFEIINNYQEKSTSVLEFKVCLDDLTVCGVLFIEWDDNNKISELRAYCNPQERYYKTK